MEYLEIFLVSAAFAAVASAAYASAFGAPWVPTRRTERESMLEMAELSGQEKVYDLGSGSGRLLFETSEAFPETELIGVELSLLPYLYAKSRRLLGWQRYRNLRFLYRDLFRYDVSDADVLFIFLMDGCYGRLKEKLTQEVKDDCRIIIEAWPFEDIKPLARVKKEGALSLYLYRGDQFR